MIYDVYVFRSSQARRSVYARVYIENMFFVVHDTCITNDFGAIAGYRPSEVIIAVATTVRLSRSVCE